MYVYSPSSIGPHALSIALPPDNAPPPYSKHHNYLIDFPPPAFFYDIQLFCMFTPLPHSDYRPYPLLSLLIMHLLPSLLQPTLFDLPPPSSSLLQFTLQWVPRFLFLALPFPQTYDNHTFHLWLILWIGAVQSYLVPSPNKHSTKYLTFLFLSSLRMGSKRYPVTSYHCHNITPRHNPKVPQHEFHRGGSLSLRKTLCLFAALELFVPLLPMSTWRMEPRNYRLDWERHSATRNCTCPTHKR